MRKRILYLDDEAICLEIFEATFGQEFDVLSAETPARARELLAEGAPDVVISDQCMREMKGTEFLSEVAAAYESPYRVLMTGTALLGGVLAEVGAGVVEAFITKPWTDESIRLVLEHAEAARRAGPRNRTTVIDGRGGDRRPQGGRALGA
jgi:DNA-binding NtrC family response regulator